MFFRVLVSGFMRGGDGEACSGVYLRTVASPRLIVPTNLHIETVWADIVLAGQCRRGVWNWCIYRELVVGLSVSDAS
jgi:hypothetical protein